MSRESIEDHPLLPQSQSPSFDFELEKEDVRLAEEARSASRRRSRKDRNIILALSLSNIILLICVGGMWARLSTSVQWRGPPPVYS